MVDIFFQYLIIHFMYTFYTIDNWPSKKSTFIANCDKRWQIVPDANIEIIGKITMTSFIGWIPLYFKCTIESNKIDQTDSNKIALNIKYNILSFGNK